MKREVNIRIDKDNTLIGSEDMGQFRGICLEKLTPCRYVKKQILHLEVATYRAGHRFLPDYLRTRNSNMGTNIF